MKNKTRNPIAKDLFTPKYKPRVTKSHKHYSRKNKHKTSEGIQKDLFYGLFVCPPFCLDSDDE